jgi:formate hydrogenlyase subunit 3/multisubunit Na+/H+ antiporter MnhD subunit
MMHPLLYPIVVPVMLGIVCSFIPKKTKAIRETLTLFSSAVVFSLTVWIFIHKPTTLSLGQSLLLKSDSLNRFILLASGFFGIVISVYSIRFMRYSRHSSMYYSALLWTMGAACGALLANHLILLLVFWGFLGITLYLLVLTGGAESGDAAKKTLLIVGGSDALILLGILLIHQYALSFEMDKIILPLKGVRIYVAFFCLVSGAFAKAGAVPLHTWIPAAADKAPIPVSAYLPAALDKLLGIYLLARISLDLFEMTKMMNLFLMCIGAITILTAVMMALIQHDLKKLMAYHAVSQVGYMVLGIGTGNPIGIAGGLFHMLNNSIYKSCLFLSGGAVQHRTQSTDLDQLGGLGRWMPVTFASFLIAAFSISGIPPFNGFFSKWMIYQGLIELGKTGDKLWVIWLVAAMFGSALTMASFMKLTHAIFLGVPSGEVNKKEIREVSLWMTGPMIALAVLCILFGIFAYALPLKIFIVPAMTGVSYLGIWAPGLAVMMILTGILIGMVIYLFGNLRGIREAGTFTGGETLPVENRITGTGFYETVRKVKGVREVLERAEAKWFDVYDQGTRLVLGIAALFRRLHTGILTFYLSWVLLGLVVLIFILMRS